jgi:hypothetical protein
MTQRPATEILNLKTKNQEIPKLVEFSKIENTGLLEDINNLSQYLNMDMFRPLVLKLTILLSLPKEYPAPIQGFAGNTIGLLDDVHSLYELNKDQLQIDIVQVRSTLEFANSYTDLLKKMIEPTDERSRIETISKIFLPKEYFIAVTFQKFGLSVAGFTNTFGFPFDQLDNIKKEIQTIGANHTESLENRIAAVNNLLAKHDSKYDGEPGLSKDKIEKDWEEISSKNGRVAYHHLKDVLNIENLDKIREITKTALEKADEIYKQADRGL